MSLFPLLSQHLGFLVSSILLIRSDELRIFAPIGHIQPLKSVRPFRRPHFHHSSRFVSFHPRRVTTAPCTYPENPTRTCPPVSLLPTRPDNIYLLRSEPKEYGLSGRISLPFFRLSFRRLYVAWSHRSCSCPPRHALLVHHE